jgi:stage V sporulation protein R
MIGAMAYTGLPTHYRHWSFGKAYERTHTLYNAGLQGLPYEMIINSNPSIAYLMRENPMQTHILTMAHCIGHSDFFKNNRTFFATKPELIIPKFKAAGKYVKELIEDPSIGIGAVEKVLDACHAIKYQLPRYPGIKRLSAEKLKQRYIKRIHEDDMGIYENFDLEKIPLEHDYNLLTFISEHSRNLSEWQKNLIDIVEENSQYFILFKKIEEESGFEGCLLAREVHNDVTFIRKHLDQKLCEDLNLFSYSYKSDRKYTTVDDISDMPGWEKIRDSLIKTIGLNSVPIIYVEELQKDHTLILRHEHDGRDLDIKYAKRVFEYIKNLWGDNIKLFTTLENELWEF